MEEITHNHIPQYSRITPVLVAVASVFSAGVGQVLCGKLIWNVILSVSSFLVTYAFSFEQVILGFLNVSTIMPLYIIQRVWLLMS